MNRRRVEPGPNANLRTTRKAEERPTAPPTCSGTFLSLPVGGALPWRDVLGAYGDLSSLAARALYAANPGGPVDARHDGQLADVVQGALRTRAGRAELRALGGARER